MATFAAKHRPPQGGEKQHERTIALCKPYSGHATASGRLHPALETPNRPMPAGGTLHDASSPTIGLWETVRVMSCRIAPRYVVPCCIMSCLVISFRAMSCHAMSCHGRDVSSSA